MVPQLYITVYNEQFRSPGTVKRAQLRPTSAHRRNNPQPRAVRHTAFNTAYVIWVTERPGWLFEILEFLYSFFSNLSPKLEVILYHPRWFRKYEKYSSFQADRIIWGNYTYCSILFGYIKKSVLLIDWLGTFFCESKQLYPIYYAGISPCLFIHPRMNRVKKIYMYVSHLFFASQGVSVSQEPSVKQ